MTHYDVEFDDIIVEGMPVEALGVEVQEEHMHGRREDYPHDEDKPRKQYTEAAHEEKEVVEEAEELEEEAKPDFPDIDGDDNRTEPITKAAKDKEGLDEAKVRQIVREALKKAFKK